MGTSLVRASEAQQVSQEQQHLEMKASVAATLLDAASNGELQSAFHEIRGTEHTSKASQETPYREEVFGQAREMLVQASTNGQLERALQQRFAPSIESVTASRGHVVPNFSVIGALFHSTGMTPGMMII